MNHTLKSIILLRENEQPENADIFYELIDASVTDNDIVGCCEFFKFWAASQKWLSLCCDDPDNDLFLKYTIVLDHYDPKIIFAYANRIVQNCNRHTNNEHQFACITHHIEHETENWLYKKNPIGTFSLHDFSLPDGKRYPPDNVEAWENFNYHLNVNLKASANQQIYHFSVSIISPLWFEKALEKEAAIYVKSAIVMKYYDEKLICNRLETLIKSCNKCRPEYALSAISHYLEYEKEAELY